MANTEVAVRFKFTPPSNGAVKLTVRSLPDDFTWVDSNDRSGTGGYRRKRFDTVAGEVFWVDVSGSLPEGHDALKMTAVARRASDEMEYKNLSIDYVVFPWVAPVEPDENPVGWKTDAREM